MSYDQEPVIASHFMRAIITDVKGASKNQAFFVRARKPRAENRSVWANTGGFEHAADAAITEKDGF